ncbi:histidine kinase N-terminal 7TM domain-containing protein [Natrialbaceae archaeon A-arb3/5]
MATEFVFVSYLLCAVLPLVLVPFVYEHRSKAGYRGTFFVIGGYSLWCFSLAFLYSVPSYEVGLAAANARHLAVYLAILGWLLIGLEYAQLADPTPKVIAVLLIPVIVAQAIAWTDPIHGLMWAESTFQSIDGWQFGPAHAIHTVYNYLLISIIIVLLVGGAIATSGLRRKQNLTLLASIIPPVVANVAFQTVETIRYDVTPAGLALSVFILAWALFRLDFLDLVPIGRKRALDEMENAVLTLDSNDRIVDYNAAARQLVGAEQSYTGRPVAEFFEPFPEVVDRLTDDGHSELSLPDPNSGEDRFFDLIASPIRNDAGTRIGSLLVFQDVSDLKERERTLQEREQELDLLRQVLTRTLRHNIRNDATLLRGYGRTIENATDGKAAEMAAEIVDVSDELVETSAKARWIEQLVRRDRTAEPVDLESTVDTIVDRYRAKYPAASFTVAVDGDPVVETNPAIELAITNLIENAIVHNDEEPSITVSIVRRDDLVDLTVEDDGPGIPATEIDVLHRGEETPLEHGSGIGLWIVYWAVEMIDASISFETSDGTSITLQIPV